jgi:hypothetical protein
MFLFILFPHPPPKHKLSEGLLQLMLFYILAPRTVLGPQHKA